MAVTPPPLIEDAEGGQMYTPSSVVEQGFWGVWACNAGANTGLSTASVAASTISLCMG